ncbi:MAG: hypothetical protein JKX98_06055 [Alcanivoracaceae bacterium]|nr:hypothetical protein [Alcanivoracaceae bacterium]
MQNYKSSFAAYRLSSAEHVQKYLRSYFAMELSPELINWYQRLLAPDTEYNAIITFNDPIYLDDIYKIGQVNLYENSTVEISTGENDYLPITLKEIDFTSIDSQLLIKENQQKRQRKKQEQLDKIKQQEDQNKPIIYTTSGKKSRDIPVHKLSTAIDRKIRIKTLRGRPIIGILTQVTAETVTIETIYKTGRATLSLNIDKISSVELM